MKVYVYIIIIEDSSKPVIISGFIKEKGWLNG